MDIYLLAVLVMTAVVAAIVVRPTWTPRWATYVAAPLVAAAIATTASGGLNPIGPPTLADVLISIFAVALLANQVLGMPAVQALISRRIGRR